MADVAFKIDNSREQKLSGMIVYVPKVKSSLSSFDDVQVKRRNENLVPFQSAALDARYDTRLDDKTYYTT